MYKQVIDQGKSVSFVLKDVDIGEQIQYSKVGEKGKAPVQGYHCSRNPRKLFLEFFFEEYFTRIRGIPRGIFKYMFDHFVMIFKLLVFLYDKFNDSKYNFMSLFLIMLFRKYEFQISELRRFLNDRN